MEKPKSSKSSQRKLVIALCVLAAVFVYWFVLRSSPDPDSAQSITYDSSTEIVCFSGGHVILEDLCDEAFINNGYATCVTPDGANLASNADCVLFPANYE